MITTTPIPTDRRTSGGGTQMHGEKSAARALRTTGGAPWAPPRPAMILALLATVLALVTVAVRPAEALVASPQFWITQANGPQFSADVSGDYVIWQGGEGGASNLYGKNLTNGANFAITTASEGQFSSAIDYNTVVWEDNTNGNWNIHRKDLPDGGELPVVTSKGDQRRPAISGDTVVWEDNRNGNYDIFGIKLDTGRKFHVVTGKGDQRRPAISGRTVVWESNSDIYGKNLATGRTFTVTKASGWQVTPDISGRTVVWKDGRDSRQDDIYGKNLATGKTFQVTKDTNENPSDQWSPSVSGQSVVWAEGRGGNADIFGRDLSTGESFPISRGVRPQDAPAIDGDTVVWESQSVGDNGFGDWNIAGSNLDASPATPTGVTAVGTSASVVLEWSANAEPDLKGYNVYRSGSAGGAYVKLNESGVLTTTAYSDTSAPSGTVSYYRITAVDQAGNESAQSATVRAARFGL